MFKSKSRGFSLGLSMAAGLFLAVSLAAPASAGLIGSYKIDGASYNVGSGATFTDLSGPAYDDWADDYITIVATGSSIKVDIYANDTGFYWDPTGGTDFTIHLTELDWSGPPGSYISGVSFDVNGTAALDSGYGATLVDATSIDLNIDGDIYNWCASELCGTLTVTIAAYEPQTNQPPAYEPPATQVDNPTSIPEPATLAVFGLGLASLGFARRRKRA